ncbi:MULTISPECIES: hypothetical protein [Paenibacillus]|uniref:SAM domain-containing protein n=2 Tax=Paenibacillus TaxID=44249 RepID=A0ABX2ZA11_PAEPO|nr:MULTISPECIES: hypothetical protein [Paenibacillus]MDR6779348.1 hypothetical protein [Paenibacillus peoriae]ODA08141.1 hypothetical protein A7312_08925 [Paenibacillus polymyxa]
MWFDGEFSDEIYEKLSIRDYKDILTNQDIKNIILRPTKEGLTKLIKIQSASLFERVRGLVIQLENTKFYDISTRVKNVVEERYKELYSGKRISEISIVSSYGENPAGKQINNPSVDDNKVSQLEKEIAELRALLMNQASQQKEQSQPDEHSTETETNKEPIVTKRPMNKKV